MSGTQRDRSDLADECGQHSPACASFDVSLIIDIGVFTWGSSVDTDCV